VSCPALRSFPEYSAALFRTAPYMGNFHKQSCFLRFLFLRGFSRRLKCGSGWRTLGSDLSHFLAGASLNAGALFCDIAVERH